MNSPLKIILIPVPLGDAGGLAAIPAYISEIVREIDSFLVEDIRSARRFISSLKLGRPIESLNFQEVRTDTPEEILGGYFETFAGKVVGVMSEAGCPGIADPGAGVVRLAHIRGIPVVPLSGPSAIFLALMASGLNGQAFSFHGYLPIDAKDRSDTIRRLEADVLRTGATQIFIEAPHRSDTMAQALVGTCGAGTRICIACNLTQPDEFVRTRTVREWRAEPVILGKRPTVFLVGR